MVDLNKIRQLLFEIELVLKESELWSDELPEEFVLNSREPFCIDTMTGPQWLQWIFLPKMTLFIDTNIPLPTRFALTPYFEESLPEGNEILLSLLQELDLLLNQEP